MIIYCHLFTQSPVYIIGFLFHLQQTFSIIVYNLCPICETNILTLSHITLDYNFYRVALWIYLSVISHTIKYQQVCIGLTVPRVINFVWFFLLYLSLPGKLPVFVTLSKIFYNFHFPVIINVLFFHLLNRMIQTGWHTYKWLQISCTVSEKNLKQTSYGQCLRRLR